MLVFNLMLVYPIQVEISAAFRDLWSILQAPTIYGIFTIIFKRPIAAF
jgi:hypothetical protein